MSGGPLTGEVALVTGAGRGIGRAIALELGRLGADIALVQRGTADETVAALQDLGRRTFVGRVDLSDALAAQQAVEDAAAALGRLDIVVCNAGHIIRKPALELSLEEWKYLVDVDLTAVFAVAQAGARRFVADGVRGRIVSVGSILSFQGGIRVAAYAACKAGVANLTRALANEWAPLGIRVNAIAPGYVENEQTAALRADPMRFSQISERIPAGRWATDADIARAVAFLVSADADYVHGHTLVVDGGWSGR